MFNTLATISIDIMSLVGNTNGWLYQTDDGKVNIEVFEDKVMLNGVTYPASAEHFKTTAGTASYYGVRYEVKSTVIEVIFPDNHGTSQMLIYRGGKAVYINTIHPHESNS